MMTRGRLVRLLAGGLVVLLAHASAWAHAVPTTMRPAANAVLPQPPQEIRIRFSERLEARASSLQVFDAHGSRLGHETAVVAPTDPWLYHLALPAIEAGVYTVSWRVMSADDGHVTEGTYIFAVGETTNAESHEASQVIAVTGWLDALP